MSYAIIRNEKYKRENLKGIYRHNERRNKNYSNKNINKDLSYLNYSLKECKYSYEKEFDLIREKYNLKGQIKTVSNIACEYIITSDKEFFDNIGAEETKRYFKTAYDFVCEYKDLGEQYILSAKVHMDEETPHMHLVFIPVVHTKDKKGNDIDKIACSEFWKEKDSYKRLQDAFYNYMIRNNFKLERGCSTREHLSVETYKEITRFNEVKEIAYEPMHKQLPVSNIEDISKLTFNRDNEINTKIIQPLKIENMSLMKENKDLYEKLIESTRHIDRLHNYEKDNQKLRDKLHILNGKVFKLENEVSILSRLVKTLDKILHSFINWVCNKFSLSEENTIKEFEQDTNIYINPEKELNNDYSNDLEW